MPRSHPPHTPEFRQEAVRLFRSSGLPLKEIADDLGCCTETLRSWVARSEIVGGKAEGLTSEEREELRRLRRENRILREEREILKKADFLRSGDRSSAMSFALIAAEKAHHSVSQVLGVSRAGYYAWAGRGPSLRRQADERLAVSVAAIHKATTGIYGATCLSVRRHAVQLAGDLPLPGPSALQHGDLFSLRKRQVSGP